MLQGTGGRAIAGHRTVRRRAEGRGQGGARQAAGSGRRADLTARQRLCTGKGEKGDRREQQIFARASASQQEEYWDGGYWEGGGGMWRTPASPARCPGGPRGGYLGAWEPGCSGALTARPCGGGLAAVPGGPFLLSARPPS